MLCSEAVLIKQGVKSRRLRRVNQGLGDVLGNSLRCQPLQQGESPALLGVPQELCPTASPASRLLLWGLLFCPDATCAHPWSWHWLNATSVTPQGCLVSGPVTPTSDKMVLKEKMGGEGERRAPSGFFAVPACPLLGLVELVASLCAWHSLGTQEVTGMVTVPGALGKPCPGWASQMLQPRAWGG